MNYKKPELTALGLAARAIQECGTKSNTTPDCESPQKSPNGAYEADE